MWSGDLRSVGRTGLRSWRCGGVDLIAALVGDRLALTPRYYRDVENRPQNWAGPAKKRKQDAKKPFDEALSPAGLVETCRMAIYPGRNAWDLKHKRRRSSPLTEEANEKASFWQEVRRLDFIR